MLRNLTRTDKTITIINYILLSLVVISVVIPLGYTLFASFMDPNTLLNSGITLNPAKWTLNGYQRVLSDSSILTGFVNSMIYSVSFSFVSVAVTLMAAYPLSRHDFIGRRFFMMVFVITMFFGGGLIPTYLLVKDLQMLDTPWAMILPGAINVWNIILARTYYQGLPGELREAASIDGATDVKYFFHILFPLCKPIIAVLILYQFVGQWNSYFDAMIYLSNANLQPLQIVLRQILVMNQPTQGAMFESVQSAAQQEKIAVLVKYACMVVSSLPLLVMYPFFQKYFEKGVLVGSIKG